MALKDKMMVEEGSTLANTLTQVAYQRHKTFLLDSLNHHFAKFLLIHVADPRHRNRRQGMYLDILSRFET